MSMVHTGYLHFALLPFRTCLSRGLCVLCRAFKSRSSKPSLQRTLKKSSSEFQEDPSLPTVWVYYIK